MKIEVAKVLQGFHGTLLSQVLPALGADYSAGSAGVIAIGMHMAAQDFDRAADVLVADNAEMRALFSAAAAWSDDSVLAAQLSAAAASSDTSFRISDLNRKNDELNALLIRLHISVEDHAGPEAGVLERGILAHLQASAGRKLLDFPA